MAAEVPPVASQPAATSALHVSWDEFHRECRTLARRLAALAPFSAMVAVTRGGLVPAAVVARELDIRVIETVSVVSYGRDDRRGDIRVVKGLGDAFAGGGAGVLVVDDLVDSGGTARRLRELLPLAHLATVYAKPAGAALVDTFVIAVAQDTWIHLPWDLGLSFNPPLVG